MTNDVPGAVGIGVDVVEMERVQGIRFLQRFAEYFLTPGEMVSFARHADSVAFIASRFAAKEAVIKAFPGLLRPHDFEIAKEGINLQKPVVHFKNAAHDSAYRAIVSMSHSTRYAAGYALVFERAPQPS